MIQIVSKKHWVTHELQGTDMSSTNKEVVLTTQKKGCRMNGKNFWKSLLGEKYFLGKPVHFSVQNTTNNAYTWVFIQQSFQHLYRTAKFKWIPSWLRSRQHKFINIGNSIFRQEEDSTNSQI